MPSRTTNVYPYWLFGSLCHPLASFLQYTLQCGRWGCKANVTMLLFVAIFVCVHAANFYYSCERFEEGVRFSHVQDLDE